MKGHFMIVCLGDDAVSLGAPDPLLHTAGWGKFHDIKVVSVDPGPARPGQRLIGNAGPGFLPVRLVFDFTVVDPVPVRMTLWGPMCRPRADDVVGPCLKGLLKPDRKRSCRKGKDLQSAIRRRAGGNARKRIFGKPSDGGTGPGGGDEAMHAQ